MPVLPAVRIEGGLLGPEVLEQLLAADLPGQRPADFGVAGRRSLTDEIAAVFADARALWDSYKAIVEACRAAWNFLIDHPQRITSIGARDWASVNV